jgi:putative flavoprotein involved in K+ transport
MNNGVEHVDTVVIGGGQTGLTVGYELAERDREFVILDAGDRVGDPWRARWDSLLLFTPARYNGLPGLDFPARGGTFVSKDTVAEYLEEYARHHNLPVRSGTRVTRLTHDGSRYVTESAGVTITSDNVVVAMADFQVPRVPDFAPDLDPDIVQMHSTKYRNPSQLQEGPVLIVGMGNSGADIGMEVSRIHETYIAGKETAHIPFRIDNWLGRNVLTRLVRFVMVRVLSTSTPIGRKAKPKMMGKAAPLVRVKPKDLEAVAKRVGRVVGVNQGKPVLDDGSVLDVANVIWCTGFRPGFDWIELPVFDPEGHPEQARGVVSSHPGLYFCGLFFLHSVWSENFVGMKIDAKYIADHLARTRGRNSMAPSLGIGEPSRLTL